jgi:hypothetical protein
MHVDRGLGAPGHGMELRSHRTEINTFEAEDSAERESAMARMVS